MQQVLDVWLVVNSFLTVVWGGVLLFHLLFRTGKGRSAKEYRSLEKVYDFTVFIALSFVSMSVTSMFLDYMPTIKGFL